MYSDRPYFRQTGPSSAQIHWCICGHSFNIRLHIQPTNLLQTPQLRTTRPCLIYLTSCSNLVYIFQIVLTLGKLLFLPREYPATTIGTYNQLDSLSTEAATTDDKAAIIPTGQMDNPSFAFLLFFFPPFSFSWPHSTDAAMRWMLR